MGVMSLISDQVGRGTSRFTRVGAAAARAVLPLGRHWRDEAVAAIEAAERWSVHPNAAARGRRCGLFVKSACRARNGFHGR